MTTFTPIQTNAMPMGSKLKNMAWRVVNKVLFRLTPPIFKYF